MADMKKVLKGLESCILHNPDDHARCMQCPYESNCVNRLKMDALELLKEQNQRIWEILTDNERLNDLLKEQLKIIHCKDCKHWTITAGEKDSFSLGYCDVINHDLVMSEGYCAWGEVKHHDQKTQAETHQADHPVP